MGGQGVQSIGLEELMAAVDLPPLIGSVAMLAQTKFEERSDRDRGWIPVTAAGALPAPKTGAGGVVL